MQSNDARILRGAAIPSACAGLVGVIVGVLAAGAEGAIGAGLATAVVITFFGLGLTAVSRIGEAWPHLLLGAGFLVYTTQVGVMLVLLLLLRDVTWMDGPVFGLTVLACLLVWLAAQAWTQTRVKQLYVEPSGAGESADAEPRA
ncbi:MULTISPECIES: hypothetical protein [unclassified Streptomyces]|uniref:hypothetical protein n=1 Tax=unclassified Streptomyces TaxID=2593676 RepID=UPI0022B6735F|nr:MULTISPECIES: hypothetical protein [unclassified Streptomyces]MCZ7416511.1 hypothetical protein [Streptomyces sp. WMMC897]MCZ7433678.1 hypothetical protein [Streptomyces sp. WMMC1477]